jgi:hypothetical protein
MLREKSYDDEPDVLGGLAGAAAGALDELSVDVAFVSFAAGSAAGALLSDDAPSAAGADPFDA